MAVLATSGAMLVELLSEEQQWIGLNLMELSCDNGFSICFNLCQCYSSKSGS
jgi:hypothetical protein